MKTKLLVILSVFYLGSITQIKAQKKVAVTTFWVNKHIGFDQLGGNSVALAAAILSLSEDPNFNLQPVLDNFYNTFTKDYAEQFPFELMKEEDVIKTEAYQNYETRWGEGNDKDSGINWKLKSNSVVFMPKPKISSWLMEETLLDGIHYIRVNDDFSDLQEKYEWCEKNQDACIEIINNANKYFFHTDDNLGQKLKNLWISIFIY